MDIDYDSSALYRYIFMVQLVSTNVEDSYVWFGVTFVINFSNYYNVSYFNSSKINTFYTPFFIRTSSFLF